MLGVSKAGSEVSSLEAVHFVGVLSFHFSANVNSQKDRALDVKMNSSSYSYHSSDSLFSNSTSARTSVDSNENFVSVNCGPTLIKSCISFGNGTLEGNR